MQAIADAIQEELQTIFSNDAGVDTNVDLNELELISFYDNNRITYHRDQSYSKKGEFKSNNCQKRNTCTCILVLGDTRHLEFQLFRNQPGKKPDKPVSHPLAQRTIPLKHGSLFFLHPEDEETKVRNLFRKSYQTFFKHRNDGVKKGHLSVGLVFRCCVETRSVYKSSGLLVPDSNQTHGKKKEKTVTARNCERKLKQYLRNKKEKEAMDNRLKDTYLSMKQRHYHSR